MIKKQTIWFSIFLAMFLIPEILWAPTITYLFVCIFYIFSNVIPQYPFWFNLLPDPKNNYINFLISLTQFIGLLGLLGFIFYKNFRTRSLIKIIVVSILIFLLFFKIIFVWMGVYYLFNSPQIG